MYKSDLVNSMSERTGMTKHDAEAALNAALSAIADAIKQGEKVHLVDFGTFEVRPRAARVAKHPQTKETIHLPAGVAPAFKPSKALKLMVNGS